MPPPFYTPPTPRRVISGVGGWGCINFGPALPTDKDYIQINFAFDGRDRYR